MTPQRQRSAPRRLGTATDIEAIVGRPAPIIILKELSALDGGCRTVLANSPIAAFGYRDGDGTSRTTFVGGAPGFARAFSTTRISFPLPGTSDPHGPVSLFFLLPGVGEILRVNGTAAGREGAQTSVDITQAWVHCAQAVLRAGLWNPPTTPSVPAHPIEGDGPLTGPGIAEFLAAAPFLALSTWDAAGGSDTSPRGDQQTVVRILDDRTLVIADRKGNKRADTLHNLLQDGHLSLAALVPGRSGVLHVRGRAAITDDPALLETMALRGMSPHLALLIDVEHAEVNGNDALVRSRLWNSDAHPDRATMPDLIALGAEHLAANAAGADGGPPAFLLKAVGAIPGLTRLVRWGIDRAYRSGLRKEGYGDTQPGAGARRGIRRQRRPDVGTGEPSLRQVRVAEVRRETPSAVTLVLEDAGPHPHSFDFRPGQYFTLVADIDGRPVRRAYSASSVPGASRLELTVKHVEDGRFSTHVHRGLRVGDRLAVRGPSGSFHAQPQPPDDIVFIAAGSGVTPMMSMIRTRLADRHGRDKIALLYSSRTTEETIFGDELDRPHHLSTLNPPQRTYAFDSDGYVSDEYRRTSRHTGDVGVVGSDECADWSEAAAQATPGRSRRIELTVSGQADAATPPQIRAGLWTKLTT